MRNHAGWLFLFVFSFLLFSSIVTADPGTNEIILFEHPNFVGQSKTYTLKSGQRHLIVHDLGALRNKISSLQAGSDVAVVLCANPPAEYQAVTDIQASLTGFHETVNSTAFHDALIIYRPKQGFPGHIVLESIGEKSSGLFTSHRPGVYYYFEPGVEGRNSLEVGRLPEHTNDNFDRLVLSPGKLGSIRVNLYPHPQFMGTPLEFPGKGSSARIFSLWDFNIGDQVSSFILAFEPVSKVGGAVSSKPKPAPPPMLPVIMEAKPIPAQPQPMAPPATVSMAGSWNSSINLPYEIEQDGDTISWFLPIALQKAKGTISGDIVDVTWVDLKGAGGNSGKIIKKDSAGRALEIHWKDGVIFFRK
ncbi:MAG: hypothetical protein KKE62_17345 [Proteobacteria bacterium]|nr:hypothetical protein [Pseudomonadota bacterium]MBU1386488.1 hypothetical protein [Pseudomonadota bacterium]MBU1544599.1 hypothetical protein [Pseudomonadota bacterium]MBU2481190.1 hypothetical protein [Pseudomonadota bacterium]